MPCTRIMSHLKVQCVTDTIGESMYVHMYNVIIEHSKIQCVTDTKVITNDYHDFTNVTQLCDLSETLVVKVIAYIPIVDLLL